jgi:hypothetical protein
VWLAAALPWGLGLVWDQSVTFHFDKHAAGSPVQRLGELVTTLLSRDIVLVAAVGLGVITALRRRSRFTSRARRDGAVVGIWLALVVVLLANEKLLLPSHVATLVIPLVLIFVLLPRCRVLAACLVALVPVQAFALSNIIWPGGSPRPEAEVVAALRELPPGATAISDIPGLVWQAGRSTARQLNDNSLARISTHRETTGMVAAGAADPKTCAVVIWSYRFGMHLPGLRAALRQRGYALELDWGRNQQVWIRMRCDPDDPAGPTRGGVALGRSPG